MLFWSLWIFVLLVVPLLASVTLGRMLPQIHRASSFVTLQKSPEAVWSAITNVEAMPTWRSGLKKVERGPDRNRNPVWIEHTRHGPMPYEWIEITPPRRLVLRIAEPKLPFGGTWTFELTPIAAGVELSITEDGEIYNPLFRVLARFFFGYHAIIDTYLRDLGRHFSQPVTPQRRE